MKVVQINSVCGVGSTGRICVGISSVLNENNIENYIYYFSGSSEYGQAKKFASPKYIRFQALKSRLLGNYGFNSRGVTKQVIKQLQKDQPDIVHIHNIHGHDVDLKMLVEYLKKANIKVVWTFHDCWLFTGYCVYFSYPKCDKWKTECQHCERKKRYSWFFDKSNKLFAKKKELLSDFDFTIVTPSRWLADLAKESFLKDKSVVTINNGIDLSKFKPRDKRNEEDGKYTVLGVAFGWEKRKGLDVFVELRKRLSDKYSIVLVGTDETVDATLPDGITSIHRTNSQEELAQLYSCADVLVNPTREENYPTVNMEALACGTPVVTFKTGGSAEIIDETCGVAVECDDIDTLEREIIRVCETKPYSLEACVTKAQSFDMHSKFEQYLELYERIYKEK